ncbi:MAG: DUF1839 family protein [Planctomycetales bacterium]
MKYQVFPLSPENYQRHLIHTRERNWVETNCYVDVLIELLHGWGFEPVAALPFTVGIDFEGDQWTFFKFPHGDLRELFGLEIQELAVWRPLVSHVEEQIALGRPVLVELDSFYLPDTAGTAYQLAHTKSTVAAIAIDVEARRLGYFHGQGYYELHGDDFDNVFRTKGFEDPAFLPPYVEIVKRRQFAMSRAELVRTSLDLLRKQLEWLPERNPFESFKDRFARDLTWLANEPLEVFHQYSFATWRQFGACYELTAVYLRWLADHGVPGLEPALAPFEELSTSARTIQFQLARAMARKKPLDLSTLDRMGDLWNNALGQLLRSEALRHPELALSSG